MADYVTLIGAESVQNAGNSISRSADVISNAASRFYETAQRLIAALDEHASRIERAMERKEEGSR